MKTNKFKFRRLKLNGLKSLKSVRFHNHQRRTDNLVKNLRLSFLWKLLTALTVTSFWKSSISYLFDRVLNTPSFIIYLDSHHHLAPFDHHLASESFWMLLYFHLRYPDIFLYFSLYIFHTAQSLMNGLGNSIRVFRKIIIN